MWGPWSLQGEEFLEVPFEREVNKICVAPTEFHFLEISKEQVFEGGGGHELCCLVRYVGRSLKLARPICHRDEGPVSCE